MKKLLLIGLFCAVGLITRASHIVGGEFEIKHITGNTYRINLILYFDKINGLAGAKDLSVMARIYRMHDNARMADVFLPLTTEEEVSYTQPECSNGEIETLKLIYTTTILLPDNQYNHPDGYYLVWERCCRNYSITNIISQAPPVNDPFFPNAAGQTFYLEFPPVVKDGQPFINSTPRLFPPLNDYACPRKPYYTDFAGTDDDGDSLVYSLVTPLNTHSAVAIPATGPGIRPFPDVKWQTGFSLNNILFGAPDLHISTDGFLTVTPTVQGLFVFAVKCEEFRDGVKIGEVRRDFQMLVVESCPVAEPPRIVGRKKGTATFTNPNQPLSVTFANTIADDDRCVQVRISDPDSEKLDDNLQEKVFIRVFPLNFKRSTRYLNELLPQVSNATLINGSTVDFEICFPECPYLPDGNYQVGIIAYDDACSLPLSDTLVVNVNVQPPPNNKPTFTTANVSTTLNEGDPPLTIPIQAVDADGDQLDVFVINDGFVLSNVGMSLNLSTSPVGQLNGQLVWDTRCDVYDFTQKTNFNFKIITDDRDKCLFAHPDTMLITLNIILPGNADPVISSSLQTAGEKTIEVTRKIYEPLSFTVTGTDADNDLLALSLHGLGFTPEVYGVSFPATTDRGLVTSTFTWFPDCSTINLDTRNQFDFRFIVVDNANKCRFYKADTLHVIVYVEPPDNSPPELSVISTNPELVVTGNSVTAVLGTPITLSFSGFDADLTPSKDQLSLQLIGSAGNVTPSGFQFENAEGPSLLTASFTWEPDCSIFKSLVYENNYLFTFLLRDNRCFNVKADTLELDITIKDVNGSDTNFLPPNFFSPNNDGTNDFFAMVAWDDLANDFINILPLDNCVGEFVNIRIYNRWGRQIFESANREFKWFGDGLPNGVYYYLVKYTHKEYRGTVTLRF
ncbi:gliding motility-associated C-terminal domain-containing protein [Oscillatoria amoena NRMC-F 0135]|nr:gliding motility-associated C-terminal domain-containing protein [Oscillatoria amoena NRMC-F 0135]